MGLRLARLDVCHLVCLVQRALSIFDSWDPSSTDSAPNDVIENMVSCDFARCFLTIIIIIKYALISVTLDV